ncbi:MAG: replication factor C large subunit [Thermoprotei archaeon]|nr:MAG: replication factor C large subunit [Thermoprotei archaeon]
MAQQLALPWTEKYRPKHVAEVVGNADAKEKFVAWIKTWLAGTPSKKAALLYGPPGVGKTTLVYAVANDFRLEVLEANASDVRTSEALKRRIMSAVRELSLFGYRGKIILLDEVDGITPSQDRGGLDTILQIIEISRHPVVMTANNPWDPKLRKLREASMLIEFKRLTRYEIISALKRICSKEGILVDYGVLKEIAKRAKGDLRAAINDLQAVAYGKKRVTSQDLMVLWERSAQLNMFEIVRSIFMARTASQAKSVLAQPNLNYEMLFHWISENIPYQYGESLEAIAEAYNALSRADVFMGRIKRLQNWTLLPYALELLTAGVAVVEHKPKFRFTRYSFPQKIKILSLTKEKREVRERVLEAIARKCHTSKREANLEYLPYIEIIYESNPSQGRKILRWLGIGERTFKKIARKKEA